LLREDPIERFKQFTWRPRPVTLLLKEEQKKIRKTLREYSKVFDEQDFNKKNLANKAVIDHRRRLLEEWRAWRARVEETIVHPTEAADEGKEEEGEVIENLEEEVIDETEEIVQ
jgi:translation initiation factor 3 subunit B